jgi:murein DD-endopeptidase MepM/ murein hydrolase activator NlpD
MGSGFRVRLGARILAGAVFMTMCGCLAMGASRTTSTAHPAARPKTSASRGAPATDTMSVRHRVVKGENLFRIARPFGVTVDDLCRANGIKDQSLVEVGQVLFVPVTRPDPRTSAADARVKPAPAAGRGRTTGSLSAALSQARGAPPQLITTSKRTVITNQDDEPADAYAYTEEIPAGEGSPKGISFSLIPSEEPFSWPVQGGIVRSPFGMRHGRQHAGIDISAPSGSPIYAARDGVVAYSGRKFRGYGNVVMVDHGDGFTSVYAHNTANLVREGDPVVRGQIIARVGATGNATGAHCHFEIRNENVSVDPKSYLSESPEDDMIFARAGSPTPSPARKLSAIPHDIIP